MDIQNGPPSNYHQPPFESKSAQPAKENTEQQQNLASHGTATAVVDHGVQQSDSAKASQSKPENVEEGLNKADDMVEGYMDKKMGGANF
ncbi:hypothetical protein INT43_007868 [Umbelopsis isabellina]|uniref:Uncharacterized protein n=1 Tax=Mortierella isabellina TaxID=91625 RepID=A0A8H7PQ35_MORIS|nr:hypothetical protein INT43_007868 [Umbelopsis isabellina]